MCRAPFPGQKVKGQGHAGRSRFWPCLLRGSVPIGPIHFICGTHTTHEVMMCRAPFLGQKVKGQGHTGRSKFWPCPLRGPVPIGPIHFICGTHTTYEMTICPAAFAGQKVKGQGHTGRSKFLLCLLCGSWYTHSPCTYTTKEGTMCRAPFPGQKDKVQCHAGRSYVNCGLWAVKGCRSYKIPRSTCFKSKRFHQFSSDLCHECAQQCRAKTCGIRIFACNFFYGF